jgi:enoyl-CoA hydratase/carnithine racemase
LINRIFADETFSGDVKNYASAYEKVSRSAVVLSKRLLYQMDGSTFESALASGVDVNTIARLTDDCQNGIAKFLNKEK